MSTTKVGSQSSMPEEDELLFWKKIYDANIDIEQCYKYIIDIKKILSVVQGQIYQSLTLNHLIVYLLETIHNFTRPDTICLYYVVHISFFQFPISY